MLSYKKIEAAREARLWIRDILVPAMVLGAVYLSDPERKTKARETFDKAMQTVASPFKKD